MKLPLAWHHTLEASQNETARLERIAANRLLLLEGREVELKVALGQFRAEKAAREDAERNLNLAQAVHTEETVSLRRIIHSEQQTRAAAQRGLTPYVYALQAFNKWLEEEPELAAQVEVIMRQLGIWGIKMGYDPDKDLALSVIYAGRA